MSNRKTIVLELTSLEMMIQGWRRAVPFQMTHSLVRYASSVASNSLISILVLLPHDGRYCNSKIIPLQHCTSAHVKINPLSISSVLKCHMFYRMTASHLLPF